MVADAPRIYEEDDYWANWYSDDQYYSDGADDYAMCAFFGIGCTTPAPSPGDMMTYPPTSVPTPGPSYAPTQVPTPVPTLVPTAAPTQGPSSVPSSVPTPLPTAVPTPYPSPECPGSESLYKLRR